MLKTLPARAALAVVALLVAPACSKEGTAPFEIARTFVVPAGTSNYGPTVQAVNLSTEAGEAWGHRDKIQHVRVTNVRIVASSVDAPAGTTATGTFAVRPATGADVLAGSLSSVPVADGTWLATGGSEALDAALDAAFKGDGQLWFVAGANANNAFGASLRVTVIGEVDYKISTGM